MLATQVDQPTGRFARFAANLRLSDAGLFGLFIFDRTAVASSVPGGVALASTLLLLAAFRRPTHRLTISTPLLVTFVSLLAFLAIESQYNGVSFTQRLLRISLLFALTMALAQGRFHIPSAITGIAFTAVCVNAPAFYLGLTPNQYPPFLTGWWGDKNVAGMWYAAIALLSLGLMERRSTKLLWLSVCATLIYLTGSRTSIAALSVAVVWYLLRNRLSVLGRLGLAGVLLWSLSTVEENFARIGAFADRVGTDWFRQMIDLATAEKLERTPWYGLGLTTATAQLSDHRVEFFHDSYAALYVEGGIVLTAVILVIYLITAIGLLSPKRRVPQLTLAAEAATITIMVCAWKLGEVFFTSIAAITLGIALAARYGAPLDEPESRRGGLRQ